MLVQPGGTIGILGGGQLGRMLTHAAHDLGYRTLILCPEENSPASQVADGTIIAPYKREEALKELAEQCDVITYEFENVPATAAQFVEKITPVLPNVKALMTAQDRVAEKTFCTQVGAPTTPFAAIRMKQDLMKQAPMLGFPCILKTARGGYDGKGQYRIEKAEDLSAFWTKLMGQSAILEAMVDFTRELSIIVARARTGALAFYPLVENEHRDHILHKTTAPAEVSEDLTRRAQEIARKLAEGLDYVGVLAVELFETADGGLLVNEMAPRVHNSGHWTIEACETSQFENHVRAICGLPLGPATLKHRAEMTNLLGDEVEGAEALARDGEVFVHLYGKEEARPGRKMGHVTKIMPL